MTGLEFSVAQKSGNCEGDTRRVHVSSTRGKLYTRVLRLFPGDIVTFDECCIAAELSHVTLNDHAYARAMNATLRGSKAVKHRAVLRSKRPQAIARLVEAADCRGDRRGRHRLHEIHQRTLQGHLALAGS